MIIEDGTGKWDANAFASLAYVDAYHASRGNTTWGGDDQLREEAIIRSSFFLSNSFHWKGYKKRGRLQSLEWPRFYVYDEEGLTVDSDTVPVEIQQAVAEVALRELTIPNSMTPDYTPADRIKMEKIGPLTTEYDLSRTDAESVRPVLLIVRDLVGALLDTGSGSRLAGASSRA